MLFLYLATLVVYSSCSHIPTANAPSIPPDGQKVQTEIFSFYIPADMKEETVSGTNSSIWRYSNGKIILNVTYGPYPDDLKSYANQPDYQKTSYEINGRKAELSTFFLDKELAAHFQGRGKYVAAVYFPDLANAFGTKLTMLANCQRPDEQEIAKKIFSSINVK